MNRPVHMTVGAITCAGTYSVLKKSLGEEPTARGLLIFSGCGAFLGCLPDILEPADNPGHRGFFHSVFILAALGYLAYRYWITTDITKNDVRVALSSLCAAYGSHLVLDGCTPAGLPLFE